MDKVTVYVYSALVMRVSPQRHPLAVLRIFLGLTQKEMGELGGCSSHTIQSVEMGKLALSKSLAERIVRATGISLAWLLAGDPTAPMLDMKDEPYSYGSFFRVQVALSIASSDPITAITREIFIQEAAMRLVYVFERITEEFQWTIVSYEFEVFMQKLLKITKSELPATSHLSLMASGFSDEVAETIKKMDSVIGNDDASAEEIIQKINAKNKEHAMSTKRIWLGPIASKVLDKSMKENPNKGPGFGKVVQTIAEQKKARKNTSS